MRYKVIISERAKEALGLHLRFLAQVSRPAAVQLKKRLLAQLRLDDALPQVHGRGEGEVRQQQQRRRVVQAPAVRALAAPAQRLLQDAQRVLRGRAAEHHGEEGAAADQRGDDGLVGRVALEAEADRAGCARRIPAPQPHLRRQTDP